MDDDLTFCHELGEDPEKPFSGQFVTRIPPELHRQVHFAAVVADKSLNAWVTEQLQNAVQRVGVIKAKGSTAAAKPRAVKRVAKRRKDIEQYA